MVISVKKLPARDKTEAKLQILSLVSKLEHQYSKPLRHPLKFRFKCLLSKVITLYHFLIHRYHVLVIHQEFYKDLKHMIYW